MSSTAASEGVEAADGRASISISWLFMREYPHQ
jgi:hypothetical protein